MEYALTLPAPLDFAPLESFVDGLRRRNKGRTTDSAAVVAHLRRTSKSFAQHKPVDIELGKCCACQTDTCQGMLHWDATLITRLQTAIGALKQARHALRELEADVDDEARRKLSPAVEAVEDALSSITDFHDYALSVRRTFLFAQSAMRTHKRFERTLEELSRR